MTVVKLVKRNESEHEITDVNVQGVQTSLV